ncbi:HigA family addiction module antitoxin [Halomonas qinghailakensis]|uniref:HigA family addiction module antitoxin n=2 Tax=Halomonas TaxID=2745 RepID=A0AA46TNM3_9GAMM|nr:MULTISPECIES: HigA family addiction module antitoxin [Halomonas]UYO73696.1 HigA family addiction module antitoxin [Halomonas sp. ZZQ-149]UYV18223.1 HigA family addiction module antidote protein [Halomonas qaidamensis]
MPPGNRLEALSGDRLGQHSIRFNELVNKKRGVTPSTALRLARFFGVSADFWMNLQMRWDLYKAEQLEHDDLSSIQEVTHWQKMA